MMMRSEATKPKRCLIADDVRSFRKTVESWLRECDFECVLAVNGEHAWEIIEDDPPDLIITDIEMPSACGLSLLRRTREAAEERIRTLPVLVMTSLRDTTTLDVVLQLGGDGLLHKPLDKQLLLSAVLDVVSDRRDFRPGKKNPDSMTGKGPGEISPTLRRLLRLVAKNERH
ncbi:PleD family two-component system response regulator [Rhodopirellula sp. SWK7]|uniref:response regulator n=1 Tax=Rhodopirellula sp. SWK7 TaxID=595460 RepID=UPI001360B3CE|nr:response regulator [Rhodopirellula sp. SWK7]